MSIIHQYLQGSPFSEFREKWTEIYESKEDNLERDTKQSSKNVDDFDKKTVPIIDKNRMMEEELKKYYNKPLWMKDVEYSPPSALPIQLPAAPFPLGNTAVTTTTRRMSKFGRHRKVSNYDPLSRYNDPKGQAFLDAISEEEDFNRMKDYAIHKDIKSIRSRRPIYWNSTTALDRTVAEDGITFEPLQRAGRLPTKLLPLSIADRSHAEITSSSSVGANGQEGSGVGGSAKPSNAAQYEPPVGRSANLDFHHRLAHEFRGDVFHTRRSSQGVYAGPLSAWQQSADSYIDSESHRRSRKRFTGKTNKTTFELSYSEENLAAQDGGNEMVDAEMGISRKRQVTDGPPHVGSLSRWFSRISPFQSGTSSTSID